MKQCRLRSLHLHFAKMLITANDNQFLMKSVLDLTKLPTMTDDHRQLLEPILKYDADHSYVIIPVLDGIDQNLTKMPIMANDHRHSLISILK